MNKLVLLFLVGSILVVPNVHAQGGGGGGASNWFSTLISRFANLFRRGPTTSSENNNNIINQAVQQQQAAIIEAQLQDQVNQALQLQAQQQETQTVFIPQEITMTEYLTSTSIVNVERFTAITETMMETITITQTATQTQRTTDISTVTVLPSCPIFPQTAEDAQLVSDFLQPSNLLSLETTEASSAAPVEKRRRAIEIESSAAMNHPRAIRTF